MVFVLYSMVLMLAKFCINLTLFVDSCLSFHRRAALHAAKEPFGFPLLASSQSSQSLKRLCQEIVFMSDWELLHLKSPIQLSSVVDLLYPC